MRDLLLVEPAQDQREVLIDECHAAGLVIAINDPDDACAILQTPKFDLATVGQESLAERSFGKLFSSLRLIAPHTKLLSLPLPSCPL